MTVDIDRRIVYVVGAGLSAGLGFPTIGNLLPKIWERLEKANLADDLAKIIRFHHPDFNSALQNTFPNIEQLLSEMQANEQLFNSSRPVTGNFTIEDLLGRRQKFLLELAGWFHELQANALKTQPRWLKKLVKKIKNEKAYVISFNWDLILDELLFGDDLNRNCYGLKSSNAIQLIKPHGSLNWYEESTGKYLTGSKKFRLNKKDGKAIYAFRPYRAPKSTRRSYMPLIVPPVLAKQFSEQIFEQLWQKVVAVLSVATEVRFLGYSLAAADFHARFILRCAFHNQEEGILEPDNERSAPTGRAKVIIVDSCKDGAGPGRIEEAVGWRCKWHKNTIEDWVNNFS